VGRGRRGAPAPVGGAVMRFVDVVFAAALAVAFVACEPPPPCPECPRAPPVVPHDAGPRDAGQPSPPSPADSGHGWPDGATRCSPDDVLANDAFLRRVDFVDRWTACTLAPRPAECVGATAGIQDCGVCLDEFLTCLAGTCASHCIRGGDSSVCRACACQRGCVDEFAACAGERSALCDLCTDETRACGPFVPTPDVMLIVTRF